MKKVSVLVLILVLILGIQAFAESLHTTSKKVFQYCSTRNLLKSEMRKCFVKLLKSKEMGDERNSIYESPSIVEELITRMTYSDGFYGGLDGYASEAEALRQCRGISRASDEVLFDCLNKALNTKGLGTRRSKLVDGYDEKNGKKLETIINNLIEASSVEGCYKLSSELIICNNVEYLKNGKCPKIVSGECKHSESALSNQSSKSVAPVVPLIKQVDSINGVELQ